MFQQVTGSEGTEVRVEPAGRGDPDSSRLARSRILTEAIVQQHFSIF
jgi:hypothetical protein